jgi:hypothetical protein
MSHATGLDVLVTVGAAMGAGVPAWFAYLGTRKTRQENQEQHGTTAANLLAVQQSVVGLGEAVGVVASDVGELKGDVKVLKGDVEHLKGRAVDDRPVD